MEIDEDLNEIETCSTNTSLESFGDISCITPDKENSSHRIGTDVSIEEWPTTVSVESFDATALVEVSDILGLIGKKWTIYHVSPLWDLHFNTAYLNLACKQLNNILMKHITTNLKNLSMQISVDIEPKEAHREQIALKIEVTNIETNVQLYSGILLKSPNYIECYKKNNLSDMPVLMVQGNKSIIVVVHNWLTDHFDCVIRPYEFAWHQFLWLIAISMGDAGQVFNGTVVYHYLYNYEFSKGQMDVKCHIESKFLRSILAKLSLNQSSSEATSFQYSDLIKVHSEIEDHLKMTSGINVSKLKLKVFEAPKIASISSSGTIYVRSSSLMDLILKFLMEQGNIKCLP